MNIKPEDEKFVRQAKDFTSRRGPKAVLLLVGSRATGFADSGSDIDTWVVGDKTTLSPSDHEQYETDEELFVDAIGHFWQVFFEGLVPIEIGNLIEEGEVNFTSLHSRANPAMRSYLSKGGTHNSTLSDSVMDSRSLLSTRCQTRNLTTS